MRYHIKGLGEVHDRYRLHYGVDTGLVWVHYVFDGQACVCMTSVLREKWRLIVDIWTVAIYGRINWILALPFLCWLLVVPDNDDCIYLPSLWHLTRASMNIRIFLSAGLILLSLPINTSVNISLTFLLLQSSFPVLSLHRPFRSPRLILFSLSLSVWAGLNKVKVEKVVNSNCKLELRHKNKKQKNNMCNPWEKMREIWM